MLRYTYTVCLILFFRRFLALPCSCLYDAIILIFKIIITIIKQDHTM